MKSVKVSLCIAFKFNDVFYSINTEEFQLSGFKILVIFRTKKNKDYKFPFLELFNNVYYVDYSPSYYGIFQALRHIRKHKFPHIDYVLFSNIRLIVVQYLVTRLIGLPNLIMVEDGLMNYLNQKVYTRNKFFKIALSFILGIKIGRIEERVLYTYLFKPEIAYYFLGITKKLRLNSCLISKGCLFDKLSNKSVLIGSNIYDYGEIDLQEYNFLTNKILKQFNIDYYVPHHSASNGERINGEILDISEYGVTFEMILSFINNLRLYSMSSSVLFSCYVMGEQTKCQPILINTYRKEFAKFFNFYRTFIKEKVIIKE